MNPWAQLTITERQTLETVLWQHSTSREVVASKLSLSRARSNAIVAGLLEQGWLTTSGAMDSDGGRRAQTLSLDTSLGVVLAASLGATSLEVALFDMNLRMLASRVEEADVRQGPPILLSRMRALMRELLAECKRKRGDVVAIGLGVPGPVDFETGQLVEPPLMPGWDRYSIRDDLRADYSAPVWVDNDVNLMALAELWRLKGELANFLVIKVGTGVGCGVVCNGAVYRGANGSAGDVGHICVDPAGTRCHCGNLGCVESIAGGPAITREATHAAKQGLSPLLAAHLDAETVITPSIVGQASRSGDAIATDIIQNAGAAVGQMLASVVNFFNPSHVFVAGGITQIGPIFLASIRQRVYERSLALSTRQLDVGYAPLGESGGLIGAAVLAILQTLRTAEARK